MNLSQISQWYGLPGSQAASQSGTDMVIIGISEENLLMMAALLARGRSVALTSGHINHRIHPHPSNTAVAHLKFYQALGIQPPSASDAEKWNDRGDKLFIFGWKIESLECFFKGLSLDPSCVGAWVNLSRYFMDPQVLDFEAASLCAQKALDLDQRCDMALSNLGGIAFAQHDLSATIEFCSRAAAINNENFFAHYYHTAALVQAKNYSPAKIQDILQHALRCKELLDQCPEAGMSIEQIITWCQSR